MATNTTDEEIHLPSPTSEKVTTRPSSALMEDPVFLAITGVILCFGIIFLLRTVVNQIKNRRYRHHRHRSPDLQRISRNVPSRTSFIDDPPPYPGKYSKTNINYLPSYDSAIKMAPELLMCNIDEMNQSINFPVLHENIEDNSGNISDHEIRGDGELCNMDQFVPVSLDPGNVRGNRSSEHFDTSPDDELDYSATNVNDSREEAVTNVSQQLDAEGDTRGDTLNVASSVNIENSG